MISKTYLITGASSGIGQQAAIEIARKDLNSQIIIPCRSKETGLRAEELLRKKSNNQNIFSLKADLSNFSDVYSLANQVKSQFGKLDVIINNAGVFNLKKVITKDHLEETYQVNYFSPFLLTHLLIDLLKESKDARIVNVSSAIHFQTRKFKPQELLETDRFSSWNNYSVSKLALILFTNHLAKILKDQNISVNSLHPGGVSTGIARGNPVLNALMRVFGTSVIKGASPLVYLAQDPDGKIYTGKYFDKENRIPVPSSTLSNSEKLGSELFDFTRDYLKLPLDKG